MFFKYTKWAMLWAMLIFILCAIPGSDLPHLSLLELISFDKFVHALLFFVLVVLLIKGFKQQMTYQFISRRATITAVVLSAIYGGLLEVMQGACFKERSADVYDFIANSVGCVLAAALFDKLDRNRTFNRFFKKIYN